MSIIDEIAAAIEEAEDEAEFQALLREEAELHAEWVENGYAEAWLAPIEGLS